MATTQPLKVVVIGAGPTGLLISLGLQQAGIEVEVYEKYDEKTYNSRPRDWSMSVHWALEYLKLLIPDHMRPDLNQSITCDPAYNGTFTGLPIYNAQTGEYLLEIPNSETLLRVSRKKLRKYLSEAINVQYGKELVSLKENEATGLVTVQFKDGTSTTASLVVGSDGGRSPTRELLLGKEAAAPQTMDYQMFNIVLSFPPEVAIRLREVEPVFRIAYHPNDHMWLLSVQDIQDLNKPEDWKFHVFMSWPGGPHISDLPDYASRVKYWKEQGKLAAEPWKTIAEHLPDDFPIPMEPVTYWEPVPDWSKTILQHQVTLAGDAAHPFPPYRGQGLNMGMQDAAGLVQQLKEAHAGTKTLTQAVADYETEMRERGQLEVNITKAQTQMVHNFGAMMDAPMMKYGMAKARELKAAQAAHAAQDSAAA